LDIWWRGKQVNGDLMLLLGHLLTLNTDWKDSKIRLRTITPKAEGNRETVLKSLKELVGEVRIPAEIEVLESDESTNVFGLMADYSRDADLVFLGLNIPEKEGIEAYAATLFDLGSRFRNVVFVRNAGKFAGELI
ncbi:MAG TPA: hypothetical protein VK995_03815, partial [Oceanipulchritudo sp.]|nr:hypothetical protein [Oceanipulchritudo sp.]